jgi:hypothetical protein
LRIHRFSLLEGYEPVTEKITKEMFSENLNTKFKLQAESPNTIELELRELTEGVSSAKHEQFALLFHGPQNPFLPQAIYQLKHEKLGELGLFLVPIGRDESGFQYEAVFNRFLKGD